MSRTTKESRRKYGWNKEYSEPKIRNNRGKTESRKLEFKNANRSIKKREKMKVRTELRKYLKSNSGGTEV